MLAPPASLLRSSFSHVDHSCFSLFNIQMFTSKIFPILLGVLISFSNCAFASMSEPARLQSHLKLVEELLRLRPVDHLAPEQLQNRLQGLDHLREYWMSGSFPSNINRPYQRHPYFIDHLGVPCAVGFLIIQSGHEQLAERISWQDNDLYLDQMEDEELKEWIRNSGFTLDELRLIQPTYSYQAKYQDPFLEAAYLGDLKTVQDLYTAGLGTNSNERIQDALRAVAPFLDVKPLKKDPPSRGSTAIYREPAPYKGQGFEVANFLISKGANVNDRSKGRNSIFFEAKSETGRKFLESKGGRLNQPEMALDAIDKEDIQQLQKYFETKGFQFYRKDSIDTPLAHALSHVLRARSSEYLVPLAQAKSPAMKVVALLIQKSNSTIRLDETLPDEDRSTVSNMSIASFALRFRMWNIIEELLKKGVSFDKKSRFILLMQFLESLHSPGNTGFQFRQETGTRSDYFTPKTRDVFEREIHKSVPYEPSELNRLIDIYINHPSLEPLLLLSRLHPNPQPYIGQWLVLRNPYSFPDIEKRLQVLAQMGGDFKKGYGSDLPIHVAVEHGDEKYIRILLKHGADINPPADRTYCPPLAVAIARENVEKVKLLLKLGANPEALYNAEISDCSQKDPSATYIQGSGYLLRPEKISQMPMSPQMKALISSHQLQKSKR